MPKPLTPEEREALIRELDKPLVDEQQDERFGGGPSDVRLVDHPDELSFEDK